MGIIGSAIGAGLGQGMALFGAQLAQNEAQRARDAERAADRWELEREKMAERRREQQAKIDLDKEKLAAKAAEPLSVDQVTAKALERELSKVPDPDPARYTGEMVGPLPEGEDDSARKLVDREGYAKASEAASEKRMGIINRVKDPSAMKSLREADYQSVVNDWVKEAAAEPDPKKREAKLQLLHRIAIAAEGKELFKGDSDVTRNIVTGATDTTAPGKAQVAQREAAAAASRASAAESYADAGLSNRTESRGGASGGSKIDATAGTNADRAADGAREDLLLELGGKKEDIAENIAKLRTRTKSGNADVRAEAEAKLKVIEPLLAKYRTALARKQELSPSKKKEADDGEKKADSGKKADDKQATPPKISAIEGAPPGARVGQKVPNKGWEVLDRNGKRIGWVRD